MRTAICRDAEPKLKPATMPCCQLDFDVHYFARDKSPTCNGRSILSARLRTFQHSNKTCKTFQDKTQSFRSYGRYQHWVFVSISK